MFPITARTRSARRTAYGGPSLLVRTVEKLTKARIDHFAIIDFAGFQDMVNAVGGIDAGEQPPRRPQCAGLRQCRLARAGGICRPAGAPAERAACPPRQGGLQRPARRPDQAVPAARRPEPRGQRRRDVEQRQVCRSWGCRCEACVRRGCSSWSARRRASARRTGRPWSTWTRSRSAELWDALRADTVGEYARRYPGDCWAALPGEAGSPTSARGRRPTARAALADSA